MILKVALSLEKKASPTRLTWKHANILIKAVEFSFTITETELHEEYIIFLFIFYKSKHFENQAISILWKISTQKGNMNKNSSFATFNTYQMTIIVSISDHTQCCQRK